VVHQWRFFIGWQIVLVLGIGQSVGVSGLVGMLGALAGAPGTAATAIALVLDCLDYRLSTKMLWYAKIILMLFPRRLSQSQQNEKMKRMFTSCLGLMYYSGYSQILSIQIFSNPSSFLLLQIIVILLDMFSGKWVRRIIHWVTSWSRQCSGQLPANTCQHTSALWDSIHMTVESHHQL